MTRLVEGEGGVIRIFEGIRANTVDTRISPIADVS